MIRVFRQRIFALLASLAAAAVSHAAGPMRLDPVTLQPPKTHPADGFVETGVTGVFFDALPCRGKPTRAFAWYGLPADRKPDGKAPGMVLVHGGGGTAFAEWVRLWTGRGYAAIAVDTCGSVPRGKYANWERHDRGGPPGWGGLTKEDVDLPAEDQWTYHAASDVALAHSLLRSLPEVDPERTGITGISWGGYLTCISAGLDDRYRLAVPVYGCGFLGDNSTWLDEFEAMGADAAGKWLAMWDPSQYLPNAKAPMLWVTGTNDFAYPMDSLQKSYRLPPGPRTLCVTIRMPHGHGGAGENPPEILAFADAILRDGEPLPKIIEEGADEARVWAAFSGNADLAKADLIYTTDGGPWVKREWKSLSATLDAATGKVSAELPAGVEAFYLNVVTGRGLTVSTEHRTR